MKAAEKHQKRIDREDAKMPKALRDVLTPQAAKQPVVYSLNLSEEQAQIVIRALDCFSRIGIGQFENILEVYDQGALQQGTLARSFVDRVKQEAGHPPNGSHGIHHRAVSDDFRAAYDIQQVLRNRVAFQRHPEGGITVDFDQPRQISKLPLPTVNLKT